MNDMHKYIKWLTTHGWKEQIVPDTPLCRLISRMLNTTYKTHMYMKALFRYSRDDSPVAHNWICVITDINDDVLTKWLHGHYVARSSYCGAVFVCSATWQLGFIGRLRQSYPDNTVRAFTLGDDDIFVHDEFVDAWEYALQYFKNMCAVRA